MFFNSSFKVVTVDSYYTTINEAGALNDNRFAIINGLMFELSHVDSEDDSFSVMIGVFDATDIYNPSHGEDITRAYGDIITGMQLHVSAEKCKADNAHTIIAGEEGNATFLHLIHRALINAPALKTELEARAD